MNNKSHLTAITRTTVSAPMRYLNKIEALHPIGLDYGCGKGHDADVLGWDRYDPYYTDGMTLTADLIPVTEPVKYPVITCNYVLNVVLPETQQTILDDIYWRLADDGVAYITVRRDIKQEGYTSRGTYQRNVVLDLPIVRETSGYCIYAMRKQS